MVYDVADPGWG